MEMGGICSPTSHAGINGNYHPVPCKEAEDDTIFWHNSGSGEFTIVTWMLSNLSSMHASREDRRWELAFRVTVWHPLKAMNLRIFTDQDLSTHSIVKAIKCMVEEIEHAQTSGNVTDQLRKRCSGRECDRPINSRVDESKC